MNKPKKWMQSKSLKGYFLKTSYFSILLSIVLISLIATLLLNMNARRYADTTSRQELNRITQNAGYVVQNLEAFMSDFTFNSNVQQQLKAYNESEAADRIKTKLVMDQYWRSYANSLGNEVSNAAVFALNGDLVGSLESFGENVRVLDYDWYAAAEASTGEALWLPSTEDPRNRPKSHLLIPVVRKIRSIDVSIGEDLGYLLVYLDAETLLDNIAPGHRQADRSIFLTGKGGGVLAHTDPAVIGTQPLGQVAGQGSEIRYGGRRYLYYSADVPRAGWQVIFLTDVASLFKDSNLVLVICLLSSLTLMAVFFLISIRNARIITRPFSTMQASFARVEQGDFDAAAVREETGIAELDDLISRYNLMVQRLENLIYENYESRLREQSLASRVQQARIEALQLQVNPHFLYNTLDSINWMALSEGNKDISRMVLALGSFFRSNLGTGAFTTIEREIENVSQFLYIQKVRFDERLEYEFDIGTNTMDRQTLRLLLQPLVENSIKHGVDPCSHPCTVRIATSCTQEQLVVEVSDNGVGMPPETLQRIQAQWRDIDRLEPGECQVGLINIMKRLALCYHDAAAFEIESSPATGTRVRVVQPVRIPN